MASALDLSMCAPCDEATRWASITGTAYMRPVLIPVCTPTVFLMEWYGFDLAACAQAAARDAGRPYGGDFLQLERHGSHVDEVASCELLRHCVLTDLAFGYCIAVPVA